MLNSSLTSASPAPSVSVVIVVWNAQKYVVECLESLERECGHLRPEIIVVDNASSDGTPELIETQFPDIKLIRNLENFGFARANNIGIAQSKGEYVCLVNSDVKFIHDCFTPMIEHMRTHPDVAMLGPKMLASDRTVRRSTMRFPTIWNEFCRAVCLDLLFKNSPTFGGQLMADFNHTKTSDVEVLNGWFWMVPRNVLAEIGLLDEQFFMYGEDIDWCYRFRKSGKRIVFFADAEAIHYGGASSSAAPMRFSVELERGTRQFLRKHHSAISRAGLFLVSLTYHGLRAIGYGALSVLKRPGRSEAVLKFHRSIACLGWLVRSRSSSG